MNSERFRFTDHGLAALACLALVGCQSAPETAPMGAGTRVVAVEGRARATDASRAWRNLKPGSALSTGDLLQTAVASDLDFAVAGAGATGAVRILLQADTVVFVESLPREIAAGAAVENGTINLHLRQGELTFTSPQSDAGPACEIRFAKGLASTRSAMFSLRAEGDLKVFRGAVTLKPADGNQARTVLAGSQYNPLTGELTPLPASDTAAPTSPQRPNRPLPPQWPPWPTRKY